jgi:hypothetical protein
MMWSSLAMGGPHRSGQEDHARFRTTHTLGRMDLRGKVPEKGEVRLIAERRDTSEKSPAVMTAPNEGHPVNLSQSREEQDSPPQLIDTLYCRHP